MGRYGRLAFYMRGQSGRCVCSSRPHTHMDLRSTIRGCIPGAHNVSFVARSGVLESLGGEQHPGVAQTALAPGRGRKSRVLTAEEATTPAIKGKLASIGATPIVSTRTKPDEDAGPPTVRRCCRTDVRCGTPFGTMLRWGACWMSTAFQTLLAFFKDTS